VCSSFLEGTSVLSDTNVIAVTTTIARGNFDITATIIPVSRTSLNDNLFRTLPQRDGNVILLGHTEQETNLLSDFVSRSPELEEPPLNNTSINSPENDEYFEEYMYDDNEDDSDTQQINQNMPIRGVNNQINMIRNKINNNKFIHQKNKLNNLRRRPAQEINDKLEEFNNEDNSHHNNKFNRPLPNTLTMQKDQLNTPLNKFSQQQEIPEMLPLVKLFLLQEKEKINFQIKINQIQMY
ncbi:hypothetical protein L9F63_026304, partial [Diploptera punctata]